MLLQTLSLRLGLVARLDLAIGVCFAVELAMIHLVLISVANLWLMTRLPGGQ
jgi:hypothetical protein